MQIINENIGYLNTDSNLTSTSKEGPQYKSFLKRVIKDNNGLSFIKIEDIQNLYTKKLKSNIIPKTSINKATKDNLKNKTKNIFNNLTDITSFKNSLKHLKYPNESSK